MKPESKLKFLPKVNNPAGLSIAFLAGWTFCFKTNFESKDTTVAVVTVLTLFIFFFSTYLTTLEIRFSKQVWGEEKRRLAVETELLWHALTNPGVRTNVVTRRALTHVDQMKELIERLPNQMLTHRFTPIQCEIVNELAALKKAASRSRGYPMNEVEEYANKIFEFIGYSEPAPQPASQEK